MVPAVVETINVTAEAAATIFTFGIDIILPSLRLR